MNDDDLPELSELVHTITKALFEFDDHLVRKEVYHDQHRRFALRARLLAIHLTSTQSLLANDLYPPAFCTLRTALEHHMTDLLMMLGYRYVQLFDGVNDEDWESLIKSYETGGPGTESMVEEPTRSRSGRVRIIRKGLYSKTDDSEEEDYALPITYFVVSDYSPFVGRPSEQDAFDDGLTDPETRRNLAKRQRDIYQQHLKWSSLTDSLRLNGFFNDDEIVELDVHYRFLSAFVHAHQEAYEIAYPRGLLGGAPPIYDHYSYELCLLYLLVIGAREIRALLQMSDQKPAIEVSDRATLEGLATRAEELSKHLWFPGSQPHEWDRIQEANRRSWRSYREGEGLRPVNPYDLDSEEVGYYENPLMRLVRLHGSFSEMTTGLSFKSAWERKDALPRAR